MSDEDLELDEQTSLQVYDKGELTLEDQDDLIVKLSLPTYEDVTDDKIAKQMREVFHGFTLNKDEDVVQHFQDADQLADYINSCMADIGESQKVGLVSRLSTNSAALGYYWKMGHNADIAITGSSYGNGACKRIAERINRSVPYVYQLRAVGTRLTLQDCYLLGMREGCNTTTLRKLAQIRDQDLCKQIIRTFIEATQDTADVINMERATRAFKLAIRDALKPDNMIEEATTNPSEVATSLEEIAGPAYAAGVGAIKKILKETKYFSSEENTVQVCDAMADFAITDSVPDAQELLDRFKVDVEQAIDQSKKMIEYLGDMLVELQSLQAVEVLGAGSKRKRSK